jgi:hypothetical protein
VILVDLTAESDSDNHMTAAGTSGSCQQPAGNLGVAPLTSAQVSMCTVTDVSTTYLSEHAVAMLFLQISSRAVAKLKINPWF